MLVKVTNCNNIDNADINIEENKLNIKLASNGTGKSSIAKAIMRKIEKPESLIEELLPFKFKENNPDNQLPEVSGLETLNTVMCFNEEYIKQFNFKEDEVMKNSFDILIKNDAYKTIERDIETLVKEIKEVFTSNAELDSLISTLKELGGAFKLTSTGVSKSSTGMKGLSSGNKLMHVPQGLEAYSPFIQSENSVVWIDWQKKGSDFLKVSSCCPFCTNDTSDKIEQIEKVQKEYDKNTIKNLLDIIKIVDKLGDYFSEDAKSKLILITQLKDGIEKEHEQFIVSIKSQIDNFVGKLEKLKTLSSFQFENEEKVSEKLPTYILNLDFFTELNSEKMRKAIGPLNNAIEELQKKAGVLQGNINKQRKEIQTMIEKHQKNINEFLLYAGYKYKVEITGKGEDSKLKLMHVDHSKHIIGGEQYLSYGEKNAFSIVLFMHECLSKQTDLIILDDPISSFDKNKKYAIFEMLFRRDSSICFKNRTVLMLTHDIEPIIDTVKSLSTKFSNISTASFLKLKDGIITEQIIERSDVKTFSEICRTIVRSTIDDLLKLIYLRRNYEIIDEKSDVYQVVSNLLHNRASAIDTREPKDSFGNFPQMATEKYDNGINRITEEIPSFSYDKTIKKLNDVSQLKCLYTSCSNGYEKLQVFRFFNFGSINSVIQKFINETYHIENEFICQLDPTKYDIIPEYVINECDTLILSI